MNALAPVVAHDRLERVLAHTGYVLKEIRHTARAGALSGDLARIWRWHLGPVERCLMLATAAQAADPGDAEQLAEAVQHDLRAGSPIPPFTSLRGEARNWAAFASPGELRAYLAACWNRLGEGERQGFLRAARPKRRAA